MARQMAGRLFTFPRGKENKAFGVERSIWKDAFMWFRRDAKVYAYEIGV